MKKHWKKILLVCIVLLLLWVGIGFYISRYCLTLSEYEIRSDKLSAPVRIVQLSDLHSTDHGKDLLDMVREQNPDLIFFTGDLINLWDEDISVTLDTLRGLCAIAPVYVSMGNHEVHYKKNNAVDLRAVYEETGAQVLDEDYVDVDINGQALRIGGIFGYCLPNTAFEVRARESRFLYEFQDTERYTLLLCHMPVCWIINGSLEYWDVDCVFAGHAHGGQVVLPFVGGLYAPDQGWLPGECSGHFEADGKHLIVSSGLGGTTPVPRFYNRPEVVVVDCLQKNNTKLQ